MSEKKYKALMVVSALLGVGLIAVFFAYIHPAMAFGWLGLCALGCSWAAMELLKENCNGK